MPRLIDLDRIKPLDFPSSEMDGLDVVRYLNTLPTIDPAPQWIPVTERLPENEVSVLICAKRKYYKGGYVSIVATAFHTDGKMNTEDSNYNWDVDNMDYDEDADAYIVPEGWWEDVKYAEEFRAVDDFVTHWMPMP